MEPLLGKVNVPDKEKGSYDDILSFNTESRSSEASFENDDELNDKTNEQIKSLISMGFDEKMIKKLYLFLTPHSVEEATNMLIKENGIYHHPFYRRESRITQGNPDLCFICGEEEKNHDNNLASQMRTSSFSSQRNTRERGQDDIICPICLYAFDEKELGGHKLSCKHLFCPSCWEEFIREKITVGDFSQLKCMEQGCKVELPIRFVKFFIKNDGELLHKYKILRLKNKILRSSDLKFCPEPDCDGYLKKGKNKFTQCQKGHKYCFECCKPWHEGKECDSIAELDKKFYEWKAGKRVKPCPNCKMFTEKNEGCNHMTCAECHFQWCWLCEKKYTIGHYESGECAGQQFVVAEKPNPNYAQRGDRPSGGDPWGEEPPPVYLKILFSFLIYPLLVVFSSFMFFAFICFGIINLPFGDDDDIECCCCPCILFLLFILIIQLPYQGVIGCITAVIMLPGLFYWNYIPACFSKISSFLKYLFPDFS